MSRGAIIIGAALVAMLTATMAYRAFPEPMDDRFDLDSYAQIPVQHGGRIKPMDSVARYVLLLISDKRSFEDEQGQARSAIEFLLDVQTAEMGNPALGDHKVFRIDSDSLLDALGLAHRPGSYRSSLKEIDAHRDELAKQIQAAQAVAQRQRDLYQRKVIELSDQLDFVTALARWLAPGLLPPSDPNDRDWATLFDGLHAEHQTQQVDRRVEAFDHILTSWAKGDAPGFNAAVKTYRDLIDPAAPSAMQRAQLEYRYSRADPLMLSAAFYLLVLLLVAVGWLGRWSALMGGAAWLTVATLIVHTAALGVRMYLQGRPPVTNLYSSAVFVGWGAVGLGLILEWIYRNGIGTMLAAVMGFLTLIVAINLEIQANGETLDVMQAVLDTNFWLATHVTSVTIGYSATFVSGFLGIVFLVGRLFGDRFTSEAARSLSRMIYGIVCFALLFSFVGTVLGGIWADQSWGRFWGWDPKENGALIIVIWNALILHARWGGMVKQRGIAMLAVLGNIVTAWSWFGVNMLGVGLHSYGFMDSAAFWMMIFIASQLLVVATGWIQIGPTKTRAT